MKLLLLVLSAEMAFSAGWEAVQRTHEIPRSPWQRVGLRNSAPGLSRLTKIRSSFTRLGREVDRAR